MRTLILKPQDRVLVIERRESSVAVHNGLVLSSSMDEALAAANGEMAVDVVIVAPAAWEPAPLRSLTLQNVHHVSHPRWARGEIGFAYEELPPQSGVCRFCGCTYRRACVDAAGNACSWLDLERTVCSAGDCIEKASQLREDLLSLTIEEGN